MTLETNRSAQVFYQAFPGRTYVHTDSPSLHDESHISSSTKKSLKFFGEHYKNVIHCISQFLGNKNINPPFKRELNKTKKCSEFVEHSQTKLTIAELSATDFQFTPEYLFFTGVNELYRSKEDIIKEQNIRKEDSLFLNRDLEFNQKIEILRNAESIQELCTKNPTRFIKKSPLCILDNKFNILYKLQRSPYLDINSIYIRGTILEKEIKNIILPLKESWTKKDNNMISPVTIEEYIPDFVDISKLQYDYFEKPELFNEAIKDLVYLSCKFFGLVAIDLYGYSIYPEDFRGEHQLNNYNFCSLYQSSQVYGSKLDRKVTKINRTIDQIVSKKEKYYFIPSVYTRQSKFDITEMTKCNFKKLPMKYCEKDNRYKFVLTDIERCRRPNLTTVDTLIYMFPKHKDLILGLFQEYNHRIIPYRLFHYGMDVKCRKSDPIPRNECFFSIEDCKDKYKISRVNSKWGKKIYFRIELCRSRNRFAIQDITYRLSEKNLYEFLNKKLTFKHKFKTLMSKLSPYPTNTPLLQISNRKFEEDNSDISSISSMNSISDIEKLSSVSDDELSIFENELDEYEYDNELDDELDKYESDNEFLNRSKSFVSVNSFASSIIELEEAKEKEEKIQEERKKNLKSINPSCMEKFVQKEELPIEVAEEIKEAKFYIGKPRCGIREKTKGVVDTNKNIPLIGDESSESESSDED